MYDLCTKVQRYNLGFQILIDHSTDEVVKAVIAFWMTILFERGLRIGIAVQLGLKTTAVVLQKSALLFGGGVGEFVRMNEGGSTLGSFSKMLQMSEFRTFWRGVVVVAFVLLEVNLRCTLFGDRAFEVTEMFLTRDKFVVAVQSACCQVDA